MKEFVDVLNLFLKNNILVNVFIYSFISEFIIYFGIRQNDRKNRLFHIFIFASFQLILINSFSISFIYAGLSSVFSAIALLALLNWSVFRSMLYKSRTNLLMNGWDILGREAYSNAPLLIRIRLKNGEIIYGIYADKSNISFSENINGIFLEKTAGLNADNNLEPDYNSHGIWINHNNIDTIDLIEYQSIEKQGVKS